MTTGGWIVMIASVGSVFMAFVWCLIQVLRPPDKTDRLHGFDHPTPDERAES